ncbi:unnamed protein product [Mycena citricolor]|uniref:Uncharacterized protein n=1 Tax=Mycena citricolor TaxID=2018698 RepID=A0AAD2K7B5_9AGAR|nr:unnamed protein product [Mycena citricolor]
MASTLGPNHDHDRPGTIPENIDGSWELLSFPFQSHTRHRAVVLRDTGPLILISRE